MNAVATKAKTKTPNARSLSLEHLAFYRALPSLEDFREVVEPDGGVL